MTRCNLIYEEEEDRDDTRCSRVRDTAGEFVRSVYFDSIIACFLIVNSILIGVEVDLEARRADGEDTPGWIQTLGLVFFAIFAVEFLLRLTVHGFCSFYTQPGWGWNVFDTTMIGLQAIP